MSRCGLSETEVREMAGEIVSILNQLARERGAEDERKEIERRRSMK